MLASDLLQENDLSAAMNTRTVSNDMYRSLEGQDRWVIENVYPGKRDGWFIEAGACDGVIGSNTLLLEREYGWKGICVEPVPSYYEDLRANRQCHTFNCCLTDTPNNVAFTLNVTARGTSSMADCRPHSLSEKFYTSGHTVETITVPGRPLQDLLREAGAPRFIEYFSFDVEGAEYRVLRSFPFDEYTFGCLTIERGSEQYGELRRLLKRLGYRHVRTGPLDDHFVHRSVKYSTPVSDRAFMAFYPIGRRLPKFLKKMLRSKWVRKKA